MNRPTINEKVALAEAIAERLAGRHGSNQFKAKGVGNISHSSEDQGRTADIAAAKVGLGSGKNPRSTAPRAIAGLQLGELWRGG